MTAGARGHGDRAKEPSTRHMLFSAHLVVGASLALGIGLTVKAVATPNSTAHDGKGPSMDAKGPFVRPRVILTAKDERVRMDAPFVVELTLENNSDSEQRLETGFGATSANAQPMFEISFPDGRKVLSYGEQALPSPQFVNYKPIAVGAHQTVILGRWDIATMTFIESAQRSGNPSGYRAFWKLVRPGVYTVRWWDGVFQLREPLFSNSVRLEVAP